VNLDDRKFMSRINTQQARLETKLEGMHEDIKDIKNNSHEMEKELQDLSKDCQLNSKFREDHLVEHRGYFNKAIAVIAVSVTLASFIGNILINLIT